MTTTPAEVLSASGAGPADTALATTALAEAVVLVGDYIDESLIDADRPVPEALRDAAVLRCAVDQFARAKAPFGQQIVPDGTGSMVAARTGADPLAGVRVLLASYCFSVGLA